MTQFEGVDHHVEGHSEGKRRLLVTLYPQSGSREKNSGAQHTSFFLNSPGPQAMEWCHPPFRDPPTLVNSIRTRLCSSN